MVVGCCLDMVLETSDTQFTKEKLGKTCTLHTDEPWRPPLSHGCHGAPLPAPRHTTISQHATQQVYIIKTKVSNVYLYQLRYLVHNALSTYHTDSHHSPCRCCERSNQYCACAAPTATPENNDAFGWCYFATAAPKGAWRRWKWPPDTTFFAPQKLPSDMVVVVRTQHHQPTTPSAETI